MILDTSGFRIGKSGSVVGRPKSNDLDAISGAPARDLDGYEKFRKRKSDEFRESSRAGRDIGKIPAIKHRARRSRARKSFLVFCESYFPDKYSLAWSNDHRRVAAKIEQVVLAGGTLAIAMPRGSGKTTFCISAVEWAILFGFHSGVALIGATETHAGQMLESIQMDLETNDRLAEDFPEVCYPVRKLEGIKQRRLLTQGQTIRMEFTADRIVLPNIAKSKAAEAYVCVAGITGRVRGIQYSRADGKVVRPSLAILDDPQTDESAKSASQSRDRENVIRKAVLGLAGPGRKIAAIMPCTIIEREDLADRLLDRKRNPQWQGERTQLVYHWPEAVKLWEEYAGIRNEGMRHDRGVGEATEFYRANRDAMDEGSEVAWKERFNPDELSALQHAMNLRQDLGDAAMFAEYQNDPPKPVSDELATLTADQVSDRVNRLPRGIVPANCTHVTAFVDVQQELLYWLVAAWSNDFTGYVIDYGVYPEQRKNYFLLRDADPTLQSVASGRTMEGSIYAGLETLAAAVVGREWRRDDGAAMRIERCLIDANWGQSTETIYAFCRSSAFANVIAPSHGRGFGAAQLPIGMWKPTPGDTHGMNWSLAGSRKGKAVRHVVIDTNWWKSFVHARLFGIYPDKGALSLFGEKAHEHRLLADQLTAESRVRTTGRGRTVDEWRIRADRPDNHWLDCLVGCAVAASMSGVSLPGQEPTKRQRRKAEIPKDRRIR